MATFKVTGRMVRISSGTLELSEAQAETRMHNLKKLSGKKFEVVNAVEFKHGEVFGYVGELPKTLAENMTTKAEADAEEKAAKATAQENARKAEQEALESAKKKEAEQEALEAEREKAEERAKATAEARANWEADENLREQFNGHFDAYLKEVLGD